MNEREPARRHLCSELIAVQLKKRRGWSLTTPALLDEIGPTSAALLLQQWIPDGTSLKLVCGDSEFLGEVRSCDHHPDLGYYASVEFDSGWEWSPGKFTPRHLFDPCTMAGSSSVAAQCARPCCNEAICPREEVARIMGAEIPVSVRVRQAAREVAGICGGLEGQEMEACFSRLFHLTSDCRLFEDFQSEYGAAREQRSHEEETHVTLVERVQNVIYQVATVRGIGTG